ncbi:MAG: alkaline phosphatase D family protein, partial [Gammaproteobacteria bacterium]|nr:alkaline phosphatase D family protein [Gammaproteobacteria bacterium]
MFLTRRRFLKTVAVSASAVTLTQLTGCFSDDNDDHGPSDALVERRKALFPQSVMSGDPRPTSIILWTRVGGFGQDVAVTLQVSRNRDFNQIIVDQALTAQAAHDHCLKVRVTALEPDRHYYYRFICDGVASNMARTRTAADPTADRKVKFAFASCQDYNGRYYNVYLRLLEADMDDLDFVVHLGDYIYETDRDPDFQTGSADRQVVFEDREGAIALRSSQGATFYAARSLSNYRQLYRTYRGDSVLQQVHEKFPLVAIWDDHEFSDDSWQNNGTYTDGAQGEGDLERKRNAEQVYFEFMPIDQDNVGEALVSAAGAIGIDPARLSQGSVDESTGVGSLSEGVSIYRALRFGQHVELFLTDFRTHRADHLIPEDAFPGQVVVPQATLQAVTPPGSPVTAFTALQAGGAFAADGGDLFTYLDMATPQAGLEALFAAVLTGNGSANPAANPFLGAAFQGYQTALTDAGLEAAAAQGRALMLAQQGLAGGVLVRVINSLLTGIRATPTGPAIIDQLNAALTGNGSPVTLVTDASGAVSLPVELTAGLRKGIGYATMGKSGLCSDLGSRYLVVKPIYDLYAAISHATGTRSQDMYGATQLNWLGEGLNQSSAT